MLLPDFCVRCAVCKSPSLHFEDYFVEKIHGQVIAGRSAVVHCSPHAFTVLIIGVLEQFIIDNTELIASSGHVLESTEAQIFLAS